MGMPVYHDIVFKKLRTREACKSDHFCNCCSNITVKVISLLRKRVLSSSHMFSYVFELLTLQHLAQLQMGIPVLIALGDFMIIMKSPKSIKIIDFHQF